MNYIFSYFIQDDRIFPPLFESASSELVAMSDFKSRSLIEVLKPIDFPQDL